MKVEVKKDEGCQVTLAIELPADRADEIYRELLADFRHNVRLPGFRRGKVPGEMIRKRFAAELRQEVISKLVPEALEEAIREEKLQPVERPTLDEVEYEEGKPLRLTASFQVQPEIELEKYTGLKVVLKDSEYEIADEEIESQLEHLRQRSANYEPIEGRPAAEGDYAFIDLRGEPRAEDAAPFRREGILVAVGKEGVPGKLIGAEPRQHLEFAIEHPEDYDDPALAGMTVEYTIDVHELKQRVLPELDDEFAKDLGQFANLDELRAEIRRQLEAEAGRKRRADSMAALLNAIAEANKPFDLPGVMVQASDRSPRGRDEAQDHRQRPQPRPHRLRLEGFPRRAAHRGGSCRAQYTSDRHRRPPAEHLGQAEAGSGRDRGYRPGQR